MDPREAMARYNSLLVQVDAAYERIAIVVALSVASLIVIIIAGAKSKDCRSYGICAAVALGMMLIGALGTKLVPAEYFGVVERFSVFAATGFNAALGLHLFFSKNDEPQAKNT